MIPLVVRRAGVFERATMLATAAVGIAGVALPYPISGALERVLGEPAASFYFGSTMILPGLLGFWAVRHAQRVRTPVQIERECRAETLALAAIAVAWLGFTVVAVSAGWPAVAVSIWFASVSIACVWRIMEIRRDLRKLHAAMLAGPRLADPPPIAEDE